MQLLAQVNVAVQRADLDDPAMAGFAAALDPVNRMAEAAPGFVWRRPGTHDRHDVTSVPDGDARLVVNISLWQDYQSLHAFVYRSAHGGLVRRRAEWFIRTGRPSTALWWITDDSRPVVEEGLRRWRYLCAHGPTPQAFDLRRRFTVDGRPVGRRPGRIP